MLGFLKGGISMTQGYALRERAVLALQALTVLVAVMTLTVLASTVARAQEFSVLDTFCTHASCLSGRSPSTVIQATDGSLYATAVLGGTHRNVLCSKVEGGLGCGTVFKITPSGQQTTIYEFCSLPNCADGALPAAALVQASNGDFYGTTEYGGANDAGTVFRITPSGKLTTLYSFCSLANCADGNLPVAALIQASDGNFYGTTGGDGVLNPGPCATATGVECGTVFKITPAGVLTTLHSFCSQPNCADGAFPVAGLLQATNGDFYGTTTAAGPAPGTPPYGGGTVFKLTASGELTTLHTFCSQPDCLDGDYPTASLMQAANGNLYGTTEGGGADGSGDILGRGTVFQITPAGRLTTLYSFCSQAYCADGVNPLGGVIQGTDGNLYGTTSQEGNGLLYESPAGTAYELTLNGELTVLYTFCTANEECTDGISPSDNLLQATSGEFYGTTAQGGSEANGGVIFALNTGLGPFVALERSSGAVGSRVTILGTDLTGASSVTFNGTTATFSVNANGSAITATVPQGATTGTVQVVTPSGVLNSNVVYRIR
jgi:uncharacterized repeat protein (TIGR03803 family)